MSYVFFNSVLAAIGKKINFESISNMYGKTTFDKKGGEAINRMIAKANPFVKESTTSSGLTLLGMPGALKVIEGADKKEKVEKMLGDISWFEEYLK